jgi:hypothetical protein
MGNDEGGHRAELIRLMKTADELLPKQGEAKPIAK